MNCYNLNANLSKLKAFKGNATKIKWYAGFFLADNTINIDYYTPLLF